MVQAELPACSLRRCGFDPAMLRIHVLQSRRYGWCPCLMCCFHWSNPKLLDNFGGAIPHHSTKTNKDVLVAALNPGAQRDQEAVWCILSSKLTAKCRSRSPEWQPSSSLMSGRLVIHALVFFCEYVQMRPDRSWSIPFHVIGKFQGNPVFHPKPKNSQIHPPHHFGGKRGVLRGLHNINPSRFATCVMRGHFEPSQDSWACMYNPNCFSAASLSVFCCWDSLRCSNPNLSGPFLERNLGGPGVFQQPAHSTTWWSPHYMQLWHAPMQQVAKGRPK